MIAECQFIVNVDPVPQPRQRFGARFSRKQGRAIPVPYRDDSSPVHTFKDAVRLAGRLAVSKTWPVGERVAYRLLCVFTMPAPADLIKRRTGRLPHNKKPDLDNLVKAVKDALKGVTWDDDGRVFDSSQLKVYPLPAGERPSVRVIVQAVEHRVDIQADAMDSYVEDWRRQAQTLEGETC
jgi:Holliday junction resolvase RusA-like endonuclease